MPSPDLQHSRTNSDIYIPVINYSLHHKYSEWFELLEWNLLEKMLWHLNCLNSIFLWGNVSTLARASQGTSAMKAGPLRCLRGVEESESCAPGAQRLSVSSARRHAVRTRQRPRVLGWPPLLTPGEVVLQLCPGILCLATQNPELFRKSNQETPSKLYPLPS